MRLFLLLLLGLIGLWTCGCVDADSDGESATVSVDDDSATVSVDD
jgi:hypothetical protein